MTNITTLSERDLALLRLLDRTPATTHLILKASSTFPGGPFRDERRARERLQRLAAARLARAFPASQGIGGPVNWYKITAESYRVLHGLDVALPHRSRFEATSPSRFHHMQTLAELIVHVLVAAHAARTAITRFFGDGELTVEGAGRKLYPDCFAQFSHAGRQFNVMFEIDHANESLDSTAANAVREKIHTYEAYQDSLWQWWKQHGDGTPRPYFRVAFLTTTAERAWHFLWLAGECAANRNRHLCYAAAQDTFLGSANPLRTPRFCSCGRRRLISSAKAQLGEYRPLEGKRPPRPLALARQPAPDQPLHPHADPPHAASDNLRPGLIRWLPLPRSPRA